MILLGEKKKKNAPPRRQGLCICGATFCVVKVCCGPRCLVLRPMVQAMKSIPMVAVG